MDYYTKYLKYKEKYIHLQNLQKQLQKQSGGLNKYIKELYDSILEKIIEKKIMDIFIYIRTHEIGFDNKKIYYIIHDDDEQNKYLKNLNERNETNYSIFFSRMNRISHYDLLYCESKESDIIESIDKTFDTYCKNYKNKNIDIYTDTNKSFDLYYTDTNKSFHLYCKDKIPLIDKIFKNKDIWKNEFIGKHKLRQYIYEKLKYDISTFTYFNKLNFEDLFLIIEFINLELKINNIFRNNWLIFDKITKQDILKLIINIFDLKSKLKNTYWKSNIIFNNEIYKNIETLENKIEILEKNIISKTNEIETDIKTEIKGEVENENKKYHPKNNQYQYKYDFSNLYNYKYNYNDIEKIKELYNFYNNS